MRPLIWAKNNWLLLLLAAVIVYFGYETFSGRNLYDNLMKKYSEQIEDHNKEIDMLEKQQEENRNIQNEMNKRFMERMAALDAKYEKKFSDLSAKRVAAKKALIEEAKKDPASLTTKVTETFGIPTYTGGGAP